MRFAILCAVLAASFACGSSDDQTTDGAGATGGVATGGAGGSGGSVSDAATGRGGSGRAGSPGTGGGAPGVDASALTACDPWPAPTGTVVQVTPAQADDLPSIVAAAASGTTIVLADGTYKSTKASEAERRIIFGKPNVTLRSASNDATKVVIDGEYATQEVLAINADDVTIAHVTVTHAYNHPIHVSPLANVNQTGVHIYGVRFVDGGQQFLKVNSDGLTSWSDRGTVECSEFVMTDAGRTHVRDNCYTGGIDTHGGQGWTVRRNRFESIYCDAGLSEHAIHFWRGSRDTLVENNVIVDCARGVGFGLGSDAGSGSRLYTDNPYPSATEYIGHYDGIIRNNVIWAARNVQDTGIGLEEARGTRVYHNTVVSADDLAMFFASIDYRFASSVVDIRDNLTRSIRQRDGSSGSVSSNLESTPLTDFVSATSLDFHLTAGAADAIDRGVTLAEGGLDMDGKAHDVGAPDLGAYERRP